MKKLTASICSIIMAMTTHAVTNTWCTVNLKDGSHQTYMIRGHLAIIPTSTQLALKSPTIQTTYNLQNVTSYKFLTQKEIDAIPQTTTPDVRILFTSPDEVNIQGISSSQSIRLFSTNGKEYFVYSNHSQDNFGGYSTNISLRSLPTGIYLITLPGTCIPAFKIVRK